MIMMSMIKQWEIHPIYIIHDNENIKSMESLAACRQALY
jgi:hypothetical protein